MARVVESEPSAHLLPPTESHGDWWPSIDRLVSPGRVVQEACDLIRSARQEVIAHVYWLMLPEVRHELSIAVARGVRHTAFGHSSQVAEVTANGWNAERIIYGGTAGVHAQAVLLADGSTGLSINRVQLRSPRKRESDVIVASSLKPSRVKQLRQELPAAAGAN